MPSLRKRRERQENALRDDVEGDKYSDDDRIVQIRNQLRKQRFDTLKLMSMWKSLLWRLAFFLAIFSLYQAGKSYRKLSLELDGANQLGDISSSGPTTSVVADFEDEGKIEGGLEVMPTGSSAPLKRDVWDLSKGSGFAACSLSMSVLSFALALYCLELMWHTSVESIDSPPPQSSSRELRSRLLQSTAWLVVGVQIAWWTWIELHNNYNLFRLKAMIEGESTLKEEIANFGNKPNVWPIGAGYYIFCRASGFYMDMMDQESRSTLEKVVKLFQPKKAA